jgi:hypothetical protein
MVKFIPHSDFQIDLTGHSYEGGGGKVMDLFDGLTNHSPLPFRIIDTSQGYPNYVTPWELGKGIRFLIDLNNGDDTAAKPVIQRLRYFDYSQLAKQITFRNADAAFDGTTAATSASARVTCYKALINLPNSSGNIIHQFTTSGTLGSAFTQIDISDVSCRFLLIQFENFWGAISELEIYTQSATPAGITPTFTDTKVNNLSLLNRMGYNDSEGNLALNDFKGGRVYRRYNYKATYANDTTSPAGSRTVNLSPFSYDYDNFISHNYGVKIISNFRGKHAATGRPPNIMSIIQDSQLISTSPVDNTNDDPENPDNYTEDFHLTYCLVKKYGHDSSAPTLPMRINHDDTPGVYGQGTWSWFEDGNEDDGQSVYTPLSQFARALGNQRACKAADPNMPYIMGGSVFRIDEYFRTFAFLSKWFAPGGDWLFDGVNIHDYYNSLPFNLGDGTATLEQKVGIKGLRPEQGDWCSLLTASRVNISRFIGARANVIDWFISEFGSDTYPNGAADTGEVGAGVTIDGTPIYGLHTPQESQAITLLRFNLHILAAKFDYAIQFQINNFLNVPDTNKILFATMGLLQNRVQPAGAPWQVSNPSPSTKKPSWYFYAQLESQLPGYKLVSRLSYDATGLNIFKFQSIADPSQIALYCYKGSEDGTTLPATIPVASPSLQKIVFDFNSETPTTQTLAVSSGNYSDTFDERGALLKYADNGNIPPTASAGADQTIQLPTNSTILNGTGSLDTDGSIVSYAWSKVSGPSASTIASPTSAITNVTGMAAGVYVFRLTVTDDDGSSATDDISITVEPAPVAVPNLFVGKPNVVVALQDITFDEAGITSLNTSIIYKVDSPIKSYVPGRIINSINGFVFGQGYYVITKMDMDLSAFLAPPIDAFIQSFVTESGENLLSEDGDGIQV